jgi:putative ABC transport system substrate-binding protein
VTTRRRFILALGSVAWAPPLAALAQQPGRISRIGFLGATSASGYAAQLEGFRLGLRDFGYTEGRNIIIEYRWAEGKYERLPALLGELIRFKAEVIVTHGTPATQAAKRATATIPIVMAVIGDAVATGVVPSIARPGGNVTGSSFFNPELMAKRLELIKEAAPHTARVAVLFNPDNLAIEPVLKAMNIVAGPLKVALEQSAVRAPGEFEGAFAEMARKHIDAVVIFDDAMLNSNAGAVVELATRRRILPVGNREVAGAGGLIGYGVNFPEIFRRAAYFVDRILKGAKPGEIPVEQATKFELVVNVKTARSLGIKFPQSVLVRADRVIE